MSAVRLLLCEAYPTVAVKEDLMVAQTITPPAYESAAASAAAVGQLVAQMFLAHPSLPVPDTENEIEKIRDRLTASQKKWDQRLNVDGWSQDEDLEEILGEMATLAQEAAEMQTRQREAAGVWPLVEQRVREYAAAAVAALSAGDGGAGKALLALRPGLEASEAAVAAKGQGSGALVIGGGAETKGLFVTIDSGRLRELLPADLGAAELGEELRAAQRALLEHERSLWLIYREYCADDGVLDGQVGEDGMMSADFARFIKDVRFPRRMLQTALLKPLLDLAHFDRSAGAWEADTFDPDPDEEDPDAERGWTFGEFSEALCRLAATAFPTQQELTGKETKWLAGAVKMLLNDFVFPRTPAAIPIEVSAASEGTEDFRRRVAGSPVRGVHQKFSEPLRKLFRHYAKAEKRGAPVSMSLFQLVEFCQDMGLSPAEDGEGGGDLQINDVRKMFAAAVAAVDVGCVKAADEDDKGSMIYYDFLECISAFAVRGHERTFCGNCLTNRYMFHLQSYCFTDPYLPIDAKLGMLIAKCAAMTCAPAFFAVG